MQVDLSFCKVQVFNVKYKYKVFSTKQIECFFLFSVFIKLVPGVAFIFLDLNMAGTYMSVPVRT